VTAPTSLADLARNPNALAPHYSRFRVAERLLLTGHSHQAWPDVAREGQIEAWDDAAARVDDKWERAAAMADRVREGFARLLGAAPGEITTGQNTHELVVRFLSALPLAQRPRLVTTDGEFHSIRRQLDRLAEATSLTIVKVAADPAASLAERLIAATDERTAAVLVSSVLFGNSHRVPGLDRVLAACRTVGAELLVDVYHHLNVVTCDLARDGLGDAFVVGGGYKYCQLGEGNCFLRVPPGRTDLAPVVTGWFAEFGHLATRPDGQVRWGEGPARWAGSTYDPTSHYRAARVFMFHLKWGLTAEFLRGVSQHQVGRLASGFDGLDLDPAVITRDRQVPLDQIGGFLTLTSPRADAIAAGLAARGVSVDVRGDWLRLGPAPYLCDDQLDAAVAALGEVVRHPEPARHG
jgi:selenocysteine lyase/cysteine desulfurase